MSERNGTIDLLSSLLEIFATVRSALATYAIGMAVTNGDQSFSIFTVAVVEGALVLSLLSIGFDPVSPITAVAALVFSAVMQYLEVTTLAGSLTGEQHQMLIFALAFAPTVLLALGILRRLTQGGNANVLGAIQSLFSTSGDKKSKLYGFSVPLVAKRASWREKRKVGNQVYELERTYDPKLKKRKSKYLGRADRKKRK